MATTTRFAPGDPTLLAAPRSSTRSRRNADWRASASLEGAADGPAPASEAAPGPALAIAESPTRSVVPAAAVSSEEKVRRLIALSILMMPSLAPVMGTGLAHGEGVDLLWTILAQSQLLHLGLQGLPADLQELGRAGDVAAGLLQRAGDQALLQLRRPLLDDVLEPRLAGGRGKGGDAAGEGSECAGTQVLRQVGHVDARAVGKEQRPLDEVLQLADVPRPGVTLHLRQRLVGHPLDALVEAAVVTFD